MLILYDKGVKIKRVGRLVIFLSFPSNTHKREGQNNESKLLFVNTQHENTNSNGEFVLKTGLKCSFYRFQVYTNKSESKIYIKTYTYKR